MKQTLMVSTDMLLRLQFGRSKKFFPAQVRNHLKVYKYNLRLLQRIYTSNPTKSLREQIRAFRQRRITILFYPDIPWENSVIYKICIKNDYRITNSLQNPFDLAIKWKDATVYRPDAAIQGLAYSDRVINFLCNDIRKDRLESVFAEVFGYPSLIDPRQYHGKCVRKSIQNAKHDGTIIECPVETIDEGFIYQILIDNQVSEDRTLDMRVPIFNGNIPFVSLWYKDIGARFQGDFEDDQYVPVSQVFSKEEQRKILRFCQLIGLDYGELDILRDRADGRIYVIDANNTPAGESRETVDIDRQACAFEDAFLNTPREYDGYLASKPLDSRALRPILKHFI